MNEDDNDLKGKMLAELGPKAKLHGPTLAYLEGYLWAAGHRQAAEQVIALRQLNEMEGAQEMNAPLDFDELQRISVLRCESPAPDGFDHKLADWSILEWAGAMAGEAGEATNVAKKMRRQRKQRDDDKVTAEQLGDELADNVCYAVLTAAKAGLDLGEAIVRKFNQISDENGFPYKLRGKATP